MIARHQPCPRHRTAALIALAAALGVAAWTDVGALAAPSPAAAGPVTAASKDDLEQQRVTIQRTREIGVAMMSWLTDQVSEGACSEDEGSAAEGLGEAESVDWSRCPAISHGELAAVLVPTYLEELPATDGWGHGLEFCLDRASACDPAYVVGVRSPGSDGRWSGDAYPVGAFGIDEVDRDVVWVDGFFMTWPERPRE